MEFIDSRKKTEFPLKLRMISDIAISLFAMFCMLRAFISLKRIWTQLQTQIELMIYVN